MATKKRTAAKPHLDYKGPPCCRPVNPTPHERKPGRYDERYGHCWMCGRFMLNFEPKGLLGESQRIEAAPTLLFGEETPPVEPGARGRRVKRTPWKGEAA